MRTMGESFKHKKYGIGWDTYCTRHAAIHMSLNQVYSFLQKQMPQEFLCLQSDSTIVGIGCVLSMEQIAHAHNGRIA